MYSLESRQLPGLKQGKGLCVPEQQTSLRETTQNTQPRTTLDKLISQVGPTGNRIRQLLMPTMQTGRPLRSPQCHNIVSVSR